MTQATNIATATKPSTRFLYAFDVEGVPDSLWVLAHTEEESAEVYRNKLAKRFPYIDALPEPRLMQSLPA
jgi:hypothetical protein